MDRDEVIRLAREAHKTLVTVDYQGHTTELDPWTLRLLERFAALVAAQEREVCAVDGFHACVDQNEAVRVRDTIRARSNNGN